MAQLYSALDSAAASVVDRWPNGSHARLQRQGHPRRLQLPTNAYERQAGMFQSKVEILCYYTQILTWLTGHLGRR